MNSCGKGKNLIFKKESMRQLTGAEMFQFDGASFQETLESAKSMSDVLCPTPLAKVPRIIITVFRSQQPKTCVLNECILPL